MKSAVIAAVVAALVASATAAGSSWINGRSIRPHSIPPNRLAGHLPRGPRGHAGLIDLSKLSENSAAGVSVAAGSNGYVTARCPTGSKAVGGGFYVAQGNDGAVQAMGSYPTSDLSGWSTFIQNNASTSASISAWAVCVSG